MIISVPSEITQVERRAVTDSAYRAKAAEVHLVEQAMMAAIGAGLPVTKPVGNLVVDIGGGTTDFALISMSGIVYSRSLRIAGNHMDEAIVNYVKRKYNLLIGERMAEKIKIEIGSAAPLEKPVTMEIKGRSLIEGIPKTITVDDSEIREALNESVAAIVGAIRLALERTPPELSADISDRGLVLAGGGALLKKPRQADPRRNRPPGMHCRRSVVQRGPGHGEASRRFQAVASHRGRLSAVGGKYSDWRNLVGRKRSADQIVDYCACQPERHRAASSGGDRIVEEPGCTLESG